MDHPELKDRAAALRRETLADLPGWIDRSRGDAAPALGRRTCTGRDARGRAPHHPRDRRARRRRLAAVKSKSMATEEIDLAGRARGRGDRHGRDRPRRVHRAGRGRAAFAHDRARDPQDARPGRGACCRPGRTASCRSSTRRSPSGRRDHLRRRFLAADLGITGANFVAADTGTIVLVTNEGNGDLCTIVPRVQVAVVPVEKVIAALLATSATLLAAADDERAPASASPTT